MSEAKLNPGDIYSLYSGRDLRRIFMSDDIYFLFEQKDWNGWNKVNNLSRELSFYGSGIEAFLAHDPVLIGHEDYNDDEVSIIRPDLPLNMGRRKDLEWSDISKLSFQNFESQFGDIFPGEISVKKLYIYPRGPKSGIKSGVAIEPDRQGVFSQQEIMWKAARIQTTAAMNHTGGVGLFRLGLKSRYPSFYTSDYYSANSDIYKAHESGFNWRAYFEEEKNRKPFLNSVKIHETGIFDITFNMDQLALYNFHEFAVQSAFSRKAFFEQLIVQDKLRIDLSGHPAGTYYFGFLIDGQFRTVESVFKL